MLATIRRISLVANERTRAVRFDFAPGKLTVSSTNPELGDARETVPIDYAGNPFFVQSPPSPAFLGWALCWVVLIVGLTVWSLHRREV